MKFNGLSTTRLEVSSCPKKKKPLQVSRPKFTGSLKAVAKLYCPNAEAACHRLAIGALPKS